MKKSAMVNLNLWVSAKGH